MQSFEIWEVAGNFHYGTQLHSLAHQLEKALQFKKALTGTFLYSKTA